MEQSLPDLTLRYGSVLVINGPHQQDSFPYSRFAHNEPHFAWEYRQGRYYALLWYHVPTSSVHLFVINAHNGSLERADLLHPYLIPQRSGEYQLIIYEQPRLIRKQTITSNLSSLDEVQAFVASHRFRDWTQGSLLIDVRDSERYVEGLPEAEARFCSCVVKVSARVSDECLEEIRNGKEEEVKGKRLGGTICVNPTKVCQASTKASSSDCRSHYLPEQMNDEQLVGYARSIGVVSRRTPSGSLDRPHLLQAIIKYSPKKKSL